MNLHALTEALKMRADYQARFWSDVTRQGGKQILARVNRLSSRIERQDQSTIELYTIARSSLRIGYVDDGRTCVMNTTARSSAGVIQKAVDAAPPQ
jgi:hypothetical protein